MTAALQPDSNTALLQTLQIPIPCTQSWDAMQGDEQVRHCGLCKKNVYNLSAMPQAEAAQLLAGNVDGALCVRFYRRSDGTVMTTDCGASPRVKLHRAMRALPRMAAGVAGAAAVATAVAHSMPKLPDRSGFGSTVDRGAVMPESPTGLTITMGAPVAMAPEEQKAQAVHDGVGAQ